ESDEAPRVEVSFEASASRIEIASSTGERGAEWSLHCAASLREASDEDARRDALTREGRLDAVRARCAEAVSPDDCYRRFRRAGLEFGPAFRGIEKLWRGEAESLGFIRAPQAIAADVARHVIHPALLDACFQVLSAALSDGGSASTLYLPVHVDRLIVLR